MIEEVQMEQLDSTVQLLSIGDKGWQKNDDAFMDMINNILNTPKRSLIFKREFALDLEPYLFRLFGIITANLIKAEIRNSLLVWIPDIEIETLDVVAQDKDRKYLVTLVVSHPTLKEIKTITTEYQSYV